MPLTKNDLDRSIEMVRALMAAGWHDDWRKELCAYLDKLANDDTVSLAGRVSNVAYFQTAVLKQGFSVDCVQSVPLGYFETCFQHSIDLLYRLFTEIIADKENSGAQPFQESLLCFSSFLLDFLEFVDAQVTNIETALGDSIKDKALLLTSCFSSGLSKIMPDIFSQMIGIVSDDLDVEFHIPYTDDHDSFDHVGMILCDCFEILYGFGLERNDLSDSLQQDPFFDFWKRTTIAQLSALSLDDSEDMEDVEFFLFSRVLKFIDYFDDSSLSHLTQIVSGWIFRLKENEDVDISLYKDIHSALNNLLLDRKMGVATADSFEKIANIFLEWHVSASSDSDNDDDEHPSVEDWSRDLDQRWRGGR